MPHERDNDASANANANANATDDDAGPTPERAPDRARGGDRASVVVARPGPFLLLVILSAFGAGYAIYYLLRSMRI